MNRWLMLEDDFERIERFHRIVGQHRWPISLQVERSAPAFIHHYQHLEVIPDLICLDHDLMPDAPHGPDPGDGRDVSNFLSNAAPTSPALIHSSNSVAADAMMFDMRDRGWFVERILPIGDDWIETHWFPSALALVARFRS